MKIIRWESQTPNDIYHPGDTIRFSINGKGFLDPYSTYIRLKIDFELYGLKQHVLQLDGSAQSLISKMVIKAGGAELERIEEYDVIAQLLLDMNYGVEGRASLGYRGVGWNTSAKTISDPSMIPKTV